MNGGGNDQDPASQDAEPGDLEELGQKYAELFGHDPFQPASSPLSGVEEDDAQAWDDADREEDPLPVTPAGIVEALLFVGDPDNTPLSSRRVASLMRGVSPREVDEIIVELNARYDAERAAYRIESRDGGYVLRLREELADVARRFAGKTRETRLSPEALEVLALVAYEQPLTRPEIDERRNADSGGPLRQLVRRRLLQWRREEGKVLYRTTPRLLQALGLESLDQLPDPAAP